MSRRPAPRRAQAGFAYIAAVVLLVVLAGLALAALRLSGAEQATVSQAVIGARAGQAARGGLEWAFYQLRGTTGTASAGGSAVTACNAVNGKTLADFAAATGFKVTLTCTLNTYVEGQQADGGNWSKNIFQLGATACNGTAAACPDSAGVAGPDYIERARSASICIDGTGADCY